MLQRFRKSLRRGQNLDLSYNDLKPEFRNALHNYIIIAFLPYETQNWLATRPSLCARVWLCHTNLHVHMMFTARFEMFSVFIVQEIFVVCLTYFHLCYDLPPASAVEVR